MTANSLVPAQETLGVASEVRQALVDLVTRHAAAEADLRQRGAAEEARKVAASAAEARRLGEELELLRKDGESTQARLEDRHRSRANRIREAERRVRKSGLERAEAEEGRSKFALQRDLLKAARDRDAGWAAADTVLGERQASLSQLGAELDRWEVEVASVFHLGKAGSRRLADGSPADPSPMPDRDWDGTMAELKAALASIADLVTSHRRSGLSLWMRAWPVWLTLILIPLPMVPVLEMAGVRGFTFAMGAWISGVALPLGLILFFLAKKSAQPAAKQAAQGLVRARRWHEQAADQALTAHAREKERVQSEHAAIAERGEAAWQAAVDRATWARTELPIQAEARARAALERNTRQLEAASRRLAEGRTDQAERIRGVSAGRSGEWEAGHRARLEELAVRWQTDLEELRQAWSRQIDRLAQVRQSAEAHASVALAPAWTQPGWDLWQPPNPMVRAARIGWLTANPCRMAGIEAGHPLANSTDAREIELPLMLCYPESGSMVLESRDSVSREASLRALNQIILRLLGSGQPGKLAVTVFDPIGLGQGFAGLMHLADEAEHLISGRIWTQTPQIEGRLAELNDHLEKVIQMYLRNEYATLAEYNEQAGDVAERYHFVVVTDFPSGFSDLAVKRLAAIANAGPRCGVHLLIHWDQRQALPADFPADLMRARDLRVAWTGNRTVTLNGQSIPGAIIRLEPPPPPEVLTPFIQRVARLGQHSNRVEVPFAYVAPHEDDRWTVSTQSEVRVAIGRTRATRQQYLALGRGTRQHVLVAGKTGSGKSTLLHVVITNLALWCRPDEVEFYLVDFKKGVEFKCYATHQLPHARVVAIESDREFGLSVLRRVDAELRRRGEIFREAGVQDVAGFREVRPGIPMPRVLLIIDEFQEFFVEEDRVAQDASLLLDRIVRQGRAFGVHVILGSQTLGGAYTVARSTMGQMAVRIALQCNEADAYLIMDETNSAPRLLSRPGEGIYNDAAGAKEGNSPFQVVWLSDAVRDAMLKQVRELAEGSGLRTERPLVFEGNAPANMADNDMLRGLLEAESSPADGLRFWLGAPNAIKGPTEIALTGRGGDHVLLVGQRSETLEAFRVALILALAAQNSGDRLRCVVLQGRPSELPESAALETALRGLPLKLEFYGPSDLEAVLSSLSEELASRSGNRGAGAGPTTVVFLDGIQNFKKLRQEDEFSFGGDDAAQRAPAQLRELVMDGATAGMHLVVSCDTYGNVLRYLGRKALAEFGFRVLQQMSATDSASLMDGPEASRLGVYRALLHDEREGVHEVFRPYSLPSAAWIANVARPLAGRRGNAMATAGR
ncbi:MAG: ATP-binding protein [Verrucomicrobiales bacterium]|nr:ATP-binding protein [Verrucomicrobiales bacterium]